MSKPIQYIFYSCDMFKTNESRDAKFIFTDSQVKKVLKYIEENKSDYFDGNPTFQEEFDTFREIARMDEGLSKAINSCMGIYATCEEIKSIQDIQY